MAEDYGYPQLETWLEKHHARLLAEGDVGNQHHQLYVLNGHLLILALQRNARGQMQGWEIYIPASADISTHNTLKAAEIACGITVS